MTTQFIVAKCPTDEMSWTNFVIVNERDFSESIKAIESFITPYQSFVFSVKHDSAVKKGTIAFNASQRFWAMLKVDQIINVRPYVNTTKIYSMTVEVDFLLRRSNIKHPETYPVDKMNDKFIEQFSGQLFTVGQKFSFLFVKGLYVIVKDIMINSETSIEVGAVDCNTKIIFEKAKNSEIVLEYPKKKRWWFF